RLRQRYQGPRPPARRRGRLAADLDGAAATRGGLEVAPPTEGAGRPPGADGAAPDLDRPGAVPRRSACPMVIRAHAHNILSLGPLRNTTFRWNRPLPDPRRWGHSI